MIGGSAAASPRRRRRPHVVDARILVFGPPAVAYTALCACLVLVLRHLTRRARGAQPSVLLAYVTLGAALGSAWVRVVCKAIVEVLVFYGDDAPMAPLAYASVWAALASLPVLVGLQHAFLRKGRAHSASASTSPRRRPLRGDERRLRRLLRRPRPPRSRISPVLSPDIPMEAPPPAAPSDVLFYFAGVGLAVFGTLLTLPLHDAHLEDGGDGRRGDDRPDADSPDGESDVRVENENVFGDAYGALHKPRGLGDDPSSAPAGAARATPATGP